MNSAAQEKLLLNAQKELRLNEALYNYVIIPAVGLAVNHLFSKIHCSGIENFIGNNCTTIFVPTHYSRLDFVLLPYVAHKYGSKPVRILARKDVMTGFNRFWMKPGGGIPGPDEDKLTLSDYKRLDAIFAEIVKQNLPLEIFAQKGRSYDGFIKKEDLKMERFAILIKSALRTGNIKFCPVNITYTAIPEIEGYSQLEAGLRGNAAATGGVDFFYLKKAFFEDNSEVFVDFLPCITISKGDEKQAAQELGEKIMHAWQEYFRSVPAEVFCYSLLQAAEEKAAKYKASDLTQIKIQGTELTRISMQTLNKIRDKRLMRDNLYNLDIEYILQSGINALSQNKRGKQVENIVLQDGHGYCINKEHSVRYYSNMLTQALNHFTQ